MSDARPPLVSTVDDASPSPSTTTAVTALHPRRAALVRIVFVMVWAGLGLLVGERFPLTNWPMYAVPGEHRGVVFVVDGEGHGVDIEGLSGRSAARVQKRLARDGDGDMDMAARVVAAGCDLRTQAAARGHTLPDDASLWWLGLQRDQTTTPTTVRVQPRPLGTVQQTCRGEGP